MTSAKPCATVAAEVSRDPRTGAASPGGALTSRQEVHLLAEAAAGAAADIADTPPSRRASWLEAVARALEADADALVDLADSETALGKDRLRGELARAVAQARFYGSVAAEGSWLGVCIDDVTSPLLCRLGRVNLPRGPVAVFAASNVPFGFGVAGHDTCSAFAAGCPVLLKAHPAQPRLSLRLGQLIGSALRDAGAPQAAFALVFGFDAGLALVDAPEVSAVAFTGSQEGGMALVERGRRRDRPIPVFAEMGTVNPTVVTHEALQRGQLPDIAREFVESLTLGQGQFCTKPGLLLTPASSGVAVAVSKAMEGTRGGWMLTEGMAEAYRRRVQEWSSAGARPVTEGQAADGGFAVPPMLFVADAEDLQPGSTFLEECFGPVALVVEYADREELRNLLARLQPSLTGAAFSGGDDDPELPWLVAKLSAQCGRVIVDGWPTGVATTWAQHHGGPWPSTSEPQATSVGAAALDRFTRPVAFQNVPDSALPPALRSANPWNVPRRVNGALQA